MCVVCDQHIAKKDGLGNCKCDVSFMQKDLTEQKLSDKGGKEKNRDLASVCDQLNDKDQFCQNRSKNLVVVCLKAQPRIRSIFADPKIQVIDNFDGWLSWTLISSYANLAQKEQK